MKVSPLVAAEVRKRFSEGEAGRVLSRFEAAELPHPSDPPDRIHFAILKLAAGRFSEVERWLREAHIDWRDVLMASGLADDNWPEVLQRAGFVAPQAAPTAQTSQSATRARRSWLFWFRIALAVAILAVVVRWLRA